MAGNSIVCLLSVPGTKIRITLDLDVGFKLDGSSETIGGVEAFG